MCGVIGAFLIHPTEEDLLSVSRVFIQTKIRGLHATGVSFIKNEKIHTIKEPIPSDIFFEKYKIYDFLNEDGNLYLIGHCRYSTSNLIYNQPISDDNISIVHNGVITQENYENWESMYGYTCITANDSELVLRSILDEKPPLLRWFDSSMAVCELRKNKTIGFYRNGKRPLYYTKLINGFIITSTENIAKRSNLNGKISKTELSVHYFYDGKTFSLNSFNENNIFQELQI